MYYTDISMPLNVFRLKINTLNKIRTHNIRKGAHD